MLHNSIRRWITTTGRHKILTPVKKAVIVSTSNDIYMNLALENWLYKNVDFTKQHLLMLWINQPCVVIGRHQNPWLESNETNMKQLNIPLARRNSGGGTVYHDSGNLNLTFFSAPEHYNRRYNLDFIAHAIYSDFNVKVDVTKREDLTVRDYKVSGTAAKLARHGAYHHCTLLVNADMKQLRHCLAPCQWEFKTNATKSIKSKIVNLQDENAEVTIDKLTKSLALNYLQHNNINFTENRSELHKQLTDLNAQFHLANRDYQSRRLDFDGLSIQLVEPSEEMFPQINEMRNELMEWKWLYGKTPKFTITKLFKIATKRFPKVIYTTSRTYAVNLHVTVENGRILDVELQMPQSYNLGELNKKVELLRQVRGMQYSDDVLEHLESVFKDDAMELMERFKNAYQTGV